MEQENKLSKKILEAAFKVHSQLGPGLLESVYEKCLTAELLLNNIQVVRQKEISITYNDIEISPAFRCDMIVENTVLLEIKSVDEIIDLHLAQTLTYLKFSKIKLGLILNFKTNHLRDGIKRVINS